jgi:predicted MFS family arabinose efflux permease
MPYWVLLKSIIGLMLTTPVLRRRSIYHACLFAAFSLFWTVTPLYLSQAPFHLSHSGIALFALAGVAGAVGTPLAGYLADKGWVRISTGCAMLAVAVSFLIARMADSDSAFLLGILVFAAILLDFGVAVNLTLGQRVIFSLNPEYRGRFNSVYMVIFFLGGALGSWIGTISYGRGGWESSAWVGFCFPILALLYFAAERKRNH